MKNGDLRSQAVLACPYIIGRAVLQLEQKSAYAV